MKKTSISTTFVKNLLFVEAFVKDGGNVAISGTTDASRAPQSGVAVELSVGTARGAKRSRFSVVDDGKTLPVALNRAVRAFSDLIHEDEKFYDKVDGMNRTMRVLDEVMGIL